MTVRPAMIRIKLQMTRWWESGVEKSLQLSMVCQCFNLHRVILLRPPAPLSELPATTLAQVGDSHTDQASRLRLERRQHFSFVACRAQRLLASC